MLPVLVFMKVSAFKKKHDYLYKKKFYFFLVFNSGENNASVLRSEDSMAREKVLSPSKRVTIKYN